MNTAVPNVICEKQKMHSIAQHTWLTSDQKMATADWLLDPQTRTDLGQDESRLRRLDYGYAGQ